MTRRDDGTRQLRAGIFLIASLGLLITSVFLLGRSRILFAHRVRLHTSFQNTSGLVVGVPVRVAGVDAGIVESIRFDRDLREKNVRVTLAVERRFLERIREDSLARLSSKGLLGDMIVDITVGSVEAAPLVDGATLRSRESEGLTEVIGSIQAGITEIRSLSATAQQRLNAVLTDELGRNLGRTVRATADVVEHVQAGDGLAHALVYDPRLSRATGGLLADARRVAASADGALGRMDRIVAEVEHGDGTLHGLIYRDDGTRLLAELRRTDRELNDVIGEIKSGHGLLHTLVYEREQGNLLENLTALSLTLRRLGDEVQQGKGTVGALLKDPSVYEDLKTILGNIKRNRLLKMLIRYTIKKDGLGADGGRPISPP